MHLEKLTIENFQAIKEPAEIEFGRLTFLYGPNSAGKSAVFDALELLHRMARSDPAFEELVTSGTRAASFDLEKGMVGNDQFITLTAVFYVDVLLLSQSEGGTEFLQSLPALHGILNDGARIEIRVQFDRENGAVPRLLRVKIDGDEVLCYSDRQTDYDPYYRVDPVRRAPTEDAFLFNYRPLQGEWTIALNHPAAADLRIDLQPRGARARLVLPEHAESVQMVRGVECGAPSGNGTPLRLSSDMLKLLFPGDVGDTDGEHWMAGRQCCLEYFELEPPHASAAHYRAFLAEEITAEHSSRLYAQLRAIAGRLNWYLDALFTMLGEALRLNRVRGDRSGFDSDQPLHLLSHLDSKDSERPNPVKGPGGQMLIVQSRQTQIYTGVRRWNGKASTPEKDLERVLAAYAVRMHGAEYRDIFGEIDEADFPNYCLGRYLHSLRKYRIIPEEYSLVMPWALEQAEDSAELPLYDSCDRSGLAGSRLVYFAVLEQSGSRRTFAEVGSSLGYLFPILVTLSEERLCGIEQPELHLHPLAQEQLADVFLHAANRGRRAIIESHSEVFLSRLAKRISDTHEWPARAAANVQAMSEPLRADADGIRIYYFFPDKDRGTVVLPIRFAPDGSLIDDWPDGMFASNWTSGLDRLRLFSGELDTEQAAKEWPWIRQVSDELIKKWLGIAWLAKRLGAGFEGIYVMHVAKVTEKCLADRLLAPMQQDFRGVPPAQMKKRWLDELDDYCGSRRRAPGLGWWEESLIKLKHRFPIEHPFVSAMRNHIAAQSWREAWESVQQQNLVGLIHDLAKLRGPAAHSGDVLGEDVERIRPLIEDGGRPGLVFRALGIVEQAEVSGLRVV